MSIVKAITIPVNTESASNTVKTGPVLLSLTSLPVLFILFLIVAFFDIGHNANIIKVREAGLEPTCDQLPFLQGISLRGYSRIY